MKLIAHRGNIFGPNPLEENQPEYIEKAMSQGYDVEIDLRYDIKTESFFLGHDDSQYVVTPYWLAQHMEKLWIHCKNSAALYHFVTKTGGYNYFWHQNDDFTLTSKNYIWSYPGQSYNSKSIIVMPEINGGVDNAINMRAYNCFGICSDYVGKMK